jgi:hypothetical protein
MLIMTTKECPGELLLLLQSALQHMGNRNRLEEVQCLLFDL